MITFVLMTNWLVLIYFITINSVYLVSSVAAFRLLRSYSRRLQVVEIDDLIIRGGAPPLTVLAPAYNEEATCVESLKSQLTLRYPSYEILLINDGSTDQTLQRLKEYFELEPTIRAPTAEVPTTEVRGVYRSRRHENLWVIDKANGGKSDALNAGINYCRTPLFCAMDSDSLLERDAMMRIVRPFLEDDTTVAVGGIIRIANDCKVEAGTVVDVRMPRGYLARMQVLEYLRAFLAGRMGWSALDAMLIISGAFGVFRRETVVEAGGYKTDTVGEDIELVVRLHRLCLENKRPYKITFIPDPVVWTQCPENLKVLGRQRNRWQRGLIETMWEHKRMLFNPRYGKVGMLAYPYFFFLEMLGPLIEMLGYVVFAVALVMGLASPLFIAAFLMVAVVLGTALSLAAVALEELSFRRYPRMSDLLRLFAFGVLENLGYRQINTWWRAQGFISKLLKQNAWGKMTRKVFTTEKDKT